MNKAKKILVVEDDEINAKMFVQYLGNKGYYTITAQNCNEVLPITLKQRPDIILMDIPIFAVTSFSRQTVYNEMGGKKFNEYVQKLVVFN